MGLLWMDKGFSVETFEIPVKLGLIRNSTPDWTRDIRQMVVGTEDD